MLSVIMLSVIMLSVIMLSVIMLIVNVVMLLTLPPMKTSNTNNRGRKELKKKLCLKVTKKEMDGKTRVKKNEDQGRML